MADSEADRTTREAMDASRHRIDSFLVDAVASQAVVTVLAPAMASKGERREPSFLGWTGQAVGYDGTRLALLEPGGDRPTIVHLGPGVAIVPGRALDHDRQTSFSY